MSAEHRETHPRPEQTNASGERPPLLAMTANVWGMAVVLGPTLVLDIFAAASTLAVVSGRVFRRGEGLARLLQALAVLGAALPWAYMLLIRPWYLRWGATDEEVEKSLPGVELVREPGRQSTRAITVNAPVEEVWPWLAQVGQGRGGFYSYEWLENLSGSHIRSADRIHPEWQHREVGDVVRTSPSFGFKVEAFEPGRAMVLEHWGAFCVEPIDQNSTRVMIRTRAPRGLGGVFYHPLVGEFPHFVMERGMLKGIKHRAERNVNARNGIMDGKVVLITGGTGGTGGIGKDIAEGLASMHASVVVVGHNRSKGEAAITELKARSGNEAVKLMLADLSSQAVNPPVG